MSNRTQITNDPDWPKPRPVDKITEVLFPHNATKAQLIERNEWLYRQNRLLQSQLDGALNIQRTYGAALDEALHKLELATKVRKESQGE